MHLQNRQHSATLPCGEGFMKGSYHWHEPGVFLEDFLDQLNQFVKEKYETFKLSVL